MKIIFHLLWLKKGSLPKRGFKSGSAFALLEDYTARIRHFCECEIRGVPSEEVERGAGKVFWWCDRGAKAKILSSEEIARNVEKAAENGFRQIHILIGGADGFTPEDEKNFPPSLRWSFGTMTLPHELAAIVAGEQIYRAWTILKRLPYHGGHAE